MLCKLRLGSIPVISNQHDKGAADYDAQELLPLRYDITEQDGPASNSAVPFTYPISLLLQVLHFVKRKLLGGLLFAAATWAEVEKQLDWIFQECHLCTANQRLQGRRCNCQPLIPPATGQLYAFLTVGPFLPSQDGGGSANPFILSNTIIWLYSELYSCP